MSTSANLDYYKSLATKRMGAGVLLLDEQDRLLIVEPTYKQHWEIPGGVVEQDESPLTAARREVREEIGIDLVPGKLRLVGLDYMAAGGGKSEALMFVFYGGYLSGDSISRICLCAKEVRSFAFCDRQDAVRKLGGTLGARVDRCLGAVSQEAFEYFEGRYE